MEKTGGREKNRRKGRERRRCMHSMFVFDCVIHKVCRHTHTHIYNDSYTYARTYTYTDIHTHTHIHTLI